MMGSSLVLAGLLMAPAQARPAAVPPVEGAVALLAQADPAAADKPRNPMAEDIEVFRRILGRKLGAARSTNFYRPSAQLSAFGSYVTTDYSGSGSHDWTVESHSAIEGVYLSAYGVVFTATMPAGARDGKPSEEKPAAKPISDWERAQMELRGEKAPAPPQAGNPRSPSVRDIILHVLAENGHHLSRLRDDERLTVVITFREGGRNATALWGPYSGASAEYPSLTSAAQSTNPFGPSTTSTIGYGVNTSQGASNKNPSSARDYEML